jgi:hypothetical protein
MRFRQDVNDCAMPIERRGRFRSPLFGQNRLRLRSRFFSRIWVVGAEDAELGLPMLPSAPVLAASFQTRPLFQSCSDHRVLQSVQGACTLDAISLSS